MDPIDGGWRVSRGGTLPGFRAEMARFPNDSLTLIVLANADGAQADEIARGIARIDLSTAVAGMRLRQIHQRFLFTRRSDAAAVAH